MKGHAEIAGAGFAGLAAAAALAQRGWSVRVHEAADAPRSFGAGIYVHPFAQAVLRGIDALEAVAAVAFLPSRRTIHVDGVSRSVTEAPRKFMTTTRDVLHGAVLAAARRAGADIAVNSRAVAAEPQGALLFEGDRRLRADLVLAADGVRSTVARNSGFVLHRMPHDDALTRVLLSREALPGATWDGIHDFYDYRHRPLRVLYTPVSQQEFYFCLMAPVHDAAANAIPVDVALWQRSFPMLAPALAGVKELGRNDRYGTTTMPRWSHGRVAAIGDAAHAMPSSLAQGAGVGMLNATMLAEALAEAPDVPAGLAAWERAARPVVERWQRQAESIAHGRSLAQEVHPGVDFAGELPDTLAALADARA